MALRVRDAGLCALLLVQLLTASLCHPGARIHGGRRLERRGLVHRDSLEGGPAKSASERFLAAVKRSQSRVGRMQKTLGRTEVGTKAAANLTSPVSAGSGEYVMQVSLGTPAQRFTAIVDTGSDLCWVQCAPCTRCFQEPNAMFDPTTSSTYSLANCTDPLCTALPRHACGTRNTCTYNYAYGDGSYTRGDLAYETVTLDSAVSHVRLGCGHYQGGSFTGTDGLMGLGQGPLSLPSQLSPAVAHVFSYCLVDQATTAYGAPSSPITFGNAAENSAATYTPLLANTANPSYYYVGVTGVTVGSTRVSVPASAFQIQANGGGGVILDSGTTLTYWIRSAFTPIIAAFRQQIEYPEADATSYHLALCYDVSSVSASSLTLPAMVVHMTNVDFDVPVSNLFSYVDNEGQTICLTMGTSSGFSIIGNIQQQNNLIVHDVVNRRVGFQAFNCATLT